MALLTPDTARLAAAKSAEARRTYAAERKNLASAIAELSHKQAAEQPAERTAKQFTDAIQVTLTQYMESTDFKARAALARAIRDLRETWHSITSTPRPGLAKGKPNANRRALNSASPDAPA